MALPEKDWFTLSEVAERWECNARDLIHHGALSRLEICVAVPEDIYGFKLFPESEYEHVTSPDSEQPGFPKIIAMQADDILAIENRGQLKIDGGRYRESVMKWYEVDSFHSDEGEPLLINVDSNDLKITRLARDKFEEEYNLGAFSEKLPSIKSN